MNPRFRSGKREKEGKMRKRGAEGDETFVRVEMLLCETVAMYHGV